MRPHIRRTRVTHDRWLVSYADFITLLFGFFVVLYAFARADQKKQAQIPLSIDAAFRSLGVFAEVSRRPADGPASGAGIEPAPIPINIVMGESVLAPARVQQDLDRIHRQLAQTLSNQVATHTVSIHMGRDGLVISLREAGFFGSGSATPKPETVPALRQIAAALAKSPYDLRVEGHTDNVPIHTPEFDSNWELSTARAARIARLLLQLNAVGPDRISAAGYAEFHPAASNGTPEGRAENRRVDLVVLPRSNIDLAQHQPATQPGTSFPWKKITDDR